MRIWRHVLWSGAALLLLCITLLFAGWQVFESERPTHALSIHQHGDKIYAAHSDGKHTIRIYALKNDSSHLVGVIRGHVAPVVHLNWQEIENEGLEILTEDQTGAIRRTKIASLNTIPSFEREHVEPLKPLWNSSIRPLITLAATYLPTNQSEEAIIERAIRAAEADRPVREREFRDKLSDGTPGPEMVVIPTGSLFMGTSEDEAERHNEGPMRIVTISQPYAVMKYEVTLTEYLKFSEATNRTTDGDCTINLGGDGNTEQTPERNFQSPGFPQGENDPVVCTSWEDAQAYASWLGSETGEHYRLLTEAEWEYAARARSISAYWWGDTASHDYANYGADECCSGLADGEDRWVNTAPVGSFSPNAFGLYDMHGNVWELVDDCYAPTYANAPIDGSARASINCQRHIARGGSWATTPLALRSASRASTDSPDERDNTAGFRLARTLRISQPSNPSSTMVAPSFNCSELSRTFTVYFEWDRTDLTSQAISEIDSVVEQIGTRSDQCVVSSVSIDGHTDAEGAASYNVTKSQRMASSVRDEFIIRGIPPSVIVTTAYGETELTVQTADGVREPLNRRAEVEIRVTTHR